jgi:hypothetical protein
MVGLLTSTESAIPSHQLRRLLDVLGCARVRNKNIGSAKKDRLPNSVAQCGHSQSQACQSSKSRRELIDV